MAQLMRAQFNATIITRTLEIVGQMEAIGPWLDFINERDRHLITMHTARAFPMGSTTAAPEHAQLYVNRSEICLIYLPDRAAHESVFMLKNTQAMICHLGPIVCRGELHLGADKTIATQIDELAHDFFPLTNADLHSTLPLAVPLPPKADLILANRAQMQFCYAA